MARPRKTTEETWYDTFSSWELEDQAIALKVLDQIHRIAEREKRKRGPEEGRQAYLQELADKA